MKTQMFAALLGLVLSTTAFAQNGAGNGGEADVRFGPVDKITHLPSIESSRFLDYLEASKYPVDLGGGTRDQMIAEAIKRLRRLDNYRAGLLEAKLAEINDPSKTFWLVRSDNHETIKKLYDATHHFEPAEEGTKTVNAAFNLTTPGPDEFYFYFVKDYFDKMSERDQAGLFLHEALYNIEAGWGATTSDGVRHIVRLISSPKILTMKQREYLAFIRLYSKKASITVSNGDFVDNYLGKVELSPTDENFVTKGAPTESVDFPAIAAETGNPVAPYEILPLDNLKLIKDIPAEFYGSSAQFGVITWYTYSNSVYRTQSDFPTKVTTDAMGKKTIQFWCFTLNQPTGPTAGWVKIDYPSMRPSGNFQITSKGLSHIVRPGVTFDFAVSQDQYGQDAFLTYDPDGHLIGLRVRAPSWHDDPIVTYKDAAGHTGRYKLRARSISLKDSNWPVQELRVTIDINGVVTDEGVYWVGESR